MSISNICLSAIRDWDSSHTIKYVKAILFLTVCRLYKTMEAGADTQQSGETAESEAQHITLAQVDLLCLYSAFCKIRYILKIRVCELA